MVYGTLFYSVRRRVCVCRRGRVTTDLARFCTVSRTRRDVSVLCAVAGMGTSVWQEEVV